MADQRVKGEDIQLSVYQNVNGQKQKIAAVNDIKSYEITFQIELLTEGYLGQSTNRLDDIYRGVNGTIEFHFGDADALKMIQTIVNRARRRAGGSAGPQITLAHQATLYMPDGTRPIISVPSMFFGDIPLTAGGREQYVGVKLAWSGEDAQFVGLG